MREAITVSREQGVDLAEDYSETDLDIADGVADDMLASMYIDLVRGNPLKVR